MNGRISQEIKKNIHGLFDRRYFSQQKHWDKATLMNKKSEEWETCGASHKLEDSTNIKVCKGKNIGITYLH